MKKIIKKNKQVLFWGLLVLLSGLFFWLLRSGPTFKGEQETESEHRQHDNENKKNEDKDSHQNKTGNQVLSKYAPEKKWKHLLADTETETLLFGNKNTSNRWIEFVFLEKKNSKIVRSEVGGYSFIPINQNGSVDDEVQTGDSAAGPNLFRLRFGLTNRSTSSGILKENQLYKIQFRINEKWYKKRFHTPALTQLQKNEVKYYPIILTKFMEEDSFDDSSRSSNVQNYELTLKITDLPQFLMEKNSSGSVWYKKDNIRVGDKYLNNWTNIEDHSIELKVNDKVVSKQDLLGGRLELYNLYHGRNEKNKCEEMRLVYLARNVSKTTLSYHKDHTYAWYPKKGIDRLLNIKRIINEESDVEYEEVQKIMFMLSEPSNGTEQSALALYKSRGCFQGSKKIKIKLPRRKYILKVETIDHKEITINKNMQWQPEPSKDQGDGREK